MNAIPFVTKVVAALKASGLEAILVGNAAAAMGGSPVTTVDLDFLFRRTPANMQKLKQFALHLGAASLVQKMYPISNHYTVVIPGEGVEVDMMSNMRGVRSFESLRSRSHLSGDIPGLRYADLKDIIASKKLCARPKDLAVLPILEATLREKESTKK